MQSSQILRGVGDRLRGRSRIIACYRNACTHLEYPIDMGKVSGGIITCPLNLRSANIIYDSATFSCTRRYLPSKRSCR
ncbi:MAG: Rieske 2Fe-2S domain-containing protein [Microcoleus sp.]